MLFVLRKLRNQMIQKNKITTYILYAIGEIFLVMIGILLAVQIDNWNEQRKMEVKIENHFREVQDNLALDIQRANEVLEYYGQMDSLIGLALADKFTIEDYKKSRVLTRIVTSAQHIKIHENGFKNLMDNSDNIPPKYKPIMELLNEMYVFQKYEIDMFGERMNLLTDQNYDFLSQNKSWHYKLRNGELDDEIIDYFMNDPYYKNKLDSYKTYAIHNYSNWIFRFAKNAILAYKMIGEQLGDTTQYPEFIPRNQIKPTAADVALFIGTFEVVESSVGNTMLGRKFTLEPYQDHLIFQFGEEGNRNEIFFKSAEQLYTGYNVTISIDSISSDTVTLLNFNGATVDFKLLKIK